MSESIRPMRAAERDSVRALLEAADLPTADLAGAAIPEFLVAASTQGDLLGAVGLEVHGGHGLLRSLVVAPSARDRGLGGRLVAAVEDLARARGVRTLWLLTTTAAAFFANRGYRATARVETPAGIAATSEFRSLCPASATLLSKPLSDSAGRGP